MRKKIEIKMDLNFVLFFICFITFVSGENVDGLELKMASVVSCF
jgi:hypothetical protein